MAEYDNTLPPGLSDMYVSAEYVMSVINLCQEALTEIKGLQECADRERFATYATAQLDSRKHQILMEIAMGNYQEVDDSEEEENNLVSVH